MIKDMQLVINELKDDPVFDGTIYPNPVKILWFIKKSFEDFV